LLEFDSLHEMYEMLAQELELGNGISARDARKQQHTHEEIGLPGIAPLEKQQVTLWTELDGPRHFAGGNLQQLLGRSRRRFPGIDQTGKAHQERGEVASEGRTGAGRKNGGEAAVSLREQSQATSGAREGLGKVDESRAETPLIAVLLKSTMEAL
jgi:hypothetical protein